MLQSLDYILDAADRIIIVDYNQDGKLYGKVVFEPDDEGDRYNPLLDKTYVRKLSESIEVPLDYKQAFYPRQFYRQHKKELYGVWRKYVDVLNSIGIADENIGIFGSPLVGFPLKKDVDFVLYGRQALLTYYEYNDYIKEQTSTTFITQEHIEYQVKKYSSMYNEKMDLRKIIERNWSGIQVGKGVLSTPRFIVEDKMIVPGEVGKDKIITCKVIYGLESACMPRYALVEYAGKEYNLYTPFWLLQSFARKGDILRISGNVDEVNKNIVLTNRKHWIEYM